MTARLTVEQLRELVYVDEQLELRWRRDRRRNAGKAGDIASRTPPSGYKIVTIGSHTYIQHRVIWAFAHGRWPNGDIDHIDGDKNNNALSNLREVTRRTNSHNRKRANRTARRTSKYLGVSWAVATQKWRAMLGDNRKQRFFGAYRVAEHAAYAYLVAKRELHDGFVGSHQRELDALGAQLSDVARAIIDADVQRRIERFRRRRP